MVSWGFIGPGTYCIPIKKVISYIAGFKKILPQMLLIKGYQN
jgi:hypothetical protein